MANKPNDVIMFTTDGSDRPAGALFFCDNHDKELRDLVQEKSRNNVSAYMSAEQVLFRLSINTMGTEGVLQYGKGCPVCAFKQFPWISQTVDTLLPPEIQA